MSLYVLDTDILTHFQNGHSAVVQHALQHPLADLATTIISVEEQFIGWYTKVRNASKRDQQARSYQRMTDAMRFLSQLQIVSFSELAMDRYDNLRSSLKRMNKNDLRIAIVLEQNAILATANLQDFKHVPGLQIVDWSK